MRETASYWALKITGKHMPYSCASTFGHTVETSQIQFVWNTFVDKFIWTGSCLLIVDASILEFRLHASTRSGSIQRNRIMIERLCIKIKNHTHILYKLIKMNMIESFGRYDRSQKLMTTPCILNYHPNQLLYERWMARKCAHNIIDVK